MASDENRRRHVRLEMTENAVAVDARGREIGKVVQASGGGVTIDAKNDDVASSLSVGERLRVTIMEPGSQTRNTIDVVLRRRSGKQLGFEFVTGAPSA